MKRKVPPHEGLVSWLKFFDTDYLDDSVCNRLSELDANRPAELSAAIQMAVRPEFDSLNELSRASMLHVLTNALTASNKELEPMFERVSMPFQSEIVDRKQFLHSIWNAFDVKPKNGESDE